MLAKRDEIEQEGNLRREAAEAAGGGESSSHQLPELKPRDSEELIELDQSLYI